MTILPNLLKVSKRLDTPWGMCISVFGEENYINTIMVNGNGAYILNIDSVRKSDIRLWYNESIILRGSIIITPEAEPILYLNTEAQFYDDPVSYTSVIRGIYEDTREKCIRRFNYPFEGQPKDGQYEILESEITRLKKLGDVRASTIVESKEGNIRHYRCDYVH